ncbi:MAG: methionyl-tRNA formyltransferase [Actinomycetota bacterium]|nr:methionyl-tRNA formyltransferase [Actinomycetota bacterium]
MSPAPVIRRRLAYLGTPAMAVPPLQALVAAGHDVAMVITRVDKRRGRGSELSPSPVKAAALQLGLPVSHSVDDVLGLEIELGVVVAFGQLIKPHVLSEVPMVNLHFSLLPRWRGAAPVERALLAGDTETGVCLMELEEGLDTGPVYDTVRVPIRPAATADDLRSELVAVGTDQLVRCLAAPLPAPVPQVGEPVYASKIRAEELRIDWSQPAEQIDRLVRLGGAWTTFRGKRVKVHAAELAFVPADGGDAALPLQQPVPGLRLVTVQPEGKGPMAFADFARGARPEPVETFE